MVCPQNTFWSFPHSVSVSRSALFHFTSNPLSQHVPFGTSTGQNSSVNLHVRAVTTTVTWTWTISVHTATFCYNSLVFRLETTMMTSRSCHKPTRGKINHGSKRLVAPQLSPCTVISLVLPPGTNWKLSQRLTQHTGTHCSSVCTLSRTFWSSAKERSGSSFTKT